MGDEKKPFNNPFGGLGTLRATLPQGPNRQELEAKNLGHAVPARAVVRLEKKGRRGKEVTVIEQLELNLEARDEWLTSLKTTLGCGGSVEGVALVLQGDHRERIATWLTRRGVKKVSVG